MATETEKKEIGNELPLLVREFEILEIKKLAKPAKDPKRAELPDDDEDAGEDVDKGDKDDDVGSDEVQGERDDDRFEVAISSEYPVQRWYGTEILDHSPEAIDLSRAKRGL